MISATELNSCSLYPKTLMQKYVSIAKGKKKKIIADDKLTNIAILKSIIHRSIVVEYLVVW